MSRHTAVESAVTDAIRHAEAGDLVSADRTLRHVVHSGVTPVEVLVEISRRNPVTVPDPTEEEPAMQVMYVGPHPEVTLAPNAGGHRFPQGEPVDVSDELAERLLRQATFKRARRGRRSRNVETPERSDPTMEVRHGESSETRNDPDSEQG